MAGIEEKMVKAHCPHCDGERVCVVHGHIYKSWEWEDRRGYSMSGGVDHSLLECRGCETVFYESSSWNSEDVDYWYDEQGDTQGEPLRTRETYPRPESKTKPAWFDAMAKVDGQLHDIITEMYIAYDNGAYILAAIGLRTALDRGTEVLGIDPAKSFFEKLAELKNGGWIGDTEKDILKVVTDAGNAAAHRGWAPESHEIVQLMYAMEVFLQRAFIVGQKALSIKSNIPAKPKRQEIPAANLPDKTS
ncbi:DUF4145 domain-containing protein [Skermanella mucosa]|uniref:DUF4145 domain-containing protein n=1 Tax=Skermanella mucosa TaxID=1789672 RepID=UPI00192BF53D|nr:DUF4145 domain-containing protein [Skermanella mucosa]UEM19108.1 DUF4145 domain-containing protein [Skermanella mucosa]